MNAAPLGPDGPASAGGDGVAPAPAGGGAGFAPVGGGGGAPVPAGGGRASALTGDGRASFLGGGGRAVSAEPVVEPARTDWLVRGLSESVGGPLGAHAVRPRRSAYGAPRFWTPVRIVLALTVLALSLHWLQKSPCRDGAWANLSQYRNLCYTDVLALYYAEGLADGKVPYRDHPVEYPVLTGALMGVLGLPVHAYAAAREGINEGEVFYDLNAIVLSALAVGTAAALLALRRRRPWDAAMFALAPGLLLSATVNWDLLAVGLTAFFMVAWARRRAVTAGVLLALAVSAKFYPVLLLGPLVILALRSGRVRRFLVTLGTATATWAAVNLPIWYLYPDSWLRFWHLNSTRGIDWGTFWYIGEHFPVADGGGFPWFRQLDQPAGHGALNAWYFGLFLIACAMILLLGLSAPRRPRLGQLAFLVVAAFLVFGKVWSQQYVLWLLPLAVLARPRWGAFLAWQAAEVGYFVAFYGELMGASGKGVFPEWVFVLAAMLRLGTLCVLMGFVVRDVLRPDLDVVRRTYDDDPDGGDFEGAPDRGLVLTLEPAPAAR